MLFVPILTHPGRKTCLHDGARLWSLNVRETGRRYASGSLCLRLNVGNSRLFHPKKLHSPPELWWKRVLIITVAVYAATKCTASDAGLAVTWKPFSLKVAGSPIVDPNARRIPVAASLVFGEAPVGSFAIVGQVPSGSTSAYAANATSERRTSLVEAAQRCRDAFAALRTSLQPEQATQSLASSEHKTDPQQLKVIDEPEQVRRTVESFRLSLRRAPVSETRRRFYELARALDTSDTRPSPARPHGMEAYRQVARALDALDGCALQVTRTQGLEQAEKIQALGHELYDHVLTAMDQMLQEARRL